MRGITHINCVHSQVEQAYIHIQEGQRSEDVGVLPRFEIQAAHRGRVSLPACLIVITLP